MKIIEKIVSGGQTGADRAAPDWAIARGIPHGGWCPKGRRAEHGVIEARYELRETPTSNYVQRTEWNVRDSDGTAIFTVGQTLTGGSKKTAELAARHGKPWIHLTKAAGGDSAAALRQFLIGNRIRALNVAGPRASKEPDVGSFVQEVLTRLVTQA